MNIRAFCFTQWSDLTTKNGNVYCKFGNFRENFIFANSVKRHICEIKNSRLGHDLLYQKIDRVISPFCEGLICTKLRFAKIKPSRKFSNLQQSIINLYCFRDTEETSLVHAHYLDHLIAAFFSIVALQKLLWPNDKGYWNINDLTESCNASEIVHRECWCCFWNTRI